MHHPLPDHELDDLLWASAPPIDERALSPHAVTVAQAVAHEMDTAAANVRPPAEPLPVPDRAARGRASPIRRRRRWAGLAVVAAVGLTAAAGYAVTARTGTFGNPANTEEDGSEWLATCAPDYPAEVAKLVPADRHLPPGITWPQITAAMVQGARTECAQEKRGVQRQVTGVRAEYEMAAACAWSQAYLHASARHDRPAMATAADQMGLTATRPAIISVDGGGIVDGYRSRAEAARRGESTPVRLDVEANCAPEWVRGVR